MSLSAHLQGPSGGHARARKSSLKLAFMLGSDAEPPLRHVSDSASVRAVLHGLADTSELSRTSELSQTQQTMQSELDAWLASASPQSRAAQCSQDDPSSHEPEPIAEGEPPAHGPERLSPPRTLTSTPRANLPRPIRCRITGSTVSPTESKEWR
jgi:hypothetical protein